MKAEKIQEGLWCFTPDMGGHLTQLMLNKDESRVFCCSAYELSDSDKWTEWTDEEKTEWEKTHPA